MSGESSSPMNGLELARSFFDGWGLPYLRSEFQQISERVAAFICGASQSLGNDDELSRDHGWGPGFGLVLTGEDMRRFGQRLRKALSKDIPKEWLGYKCPASLPVNSIDQWFYRFIRRTHPPKTPRGWVKKAEFHLYMLRHAPVFHDPLGEFTARRKEFWYYPHAAWLRRLADESFNVWHFGQYNFLERLTHRKDPIAISICLGSFIQATMKVCMLLEEDFTPYWKWLAAEFRKLPNVADLEARLSELSVCHELDRQAALVDVICKDIHARLVARGLVIANPTDHPHPLLCASGELAGKASALKG